MDRRDIGAIRIKQDKSFFEVREQSVAAFVKSIGPDMVIEKGVVATMLDGAPDFGPDRAGGSRPKGKSAGQRKDRQTKKWDENKPKGRLETRDDRPKKPKYQKDTGAGAKEDRKPTAKPAKRADGKPHGKETRPSDYKKPEGRKQDGSSSHGREFKKSDRTEDRPRKPKLTEAGRRAASQRWDPKAKDGKSGGNAAPRRRADGTKPKFDKRKDGDRKGPPPPKGKPNSKKNKARAAAKKLAATKKGPRRGD